MTSLLKETCRILSAWFLLWHAVAAAEPVALDGLLDEMIDLRALCEFPDPPFTCRQFSSYDRHAESPEKDWFANGDAGNYIRVEERGRRKEYVMMDAEGPGAVVRIWSANPNGTLRFYLDGNEVPALEGSMKKLLSGAFPGIPKPLSGKRSMGWNLYFPIPYVRHCKVTSDAGGFYYHVGYRTYAEGTTVRSFSMDDFHALARKIDRIADRLNSPRLGGGPPATRERQHFGENVAAGGTQTLLELAGPAAICELTVDTDELTDRALRSLVLEITFDGEQTVQVPLGDFFGSSPGINPYASLPLGMTHSDEMWCHWFMPFGQTARIAVTNTATRPLRVKGIAARVPYTWTDRSMYFNAGWRNEYGAPAQPHRDWNYLTARGKGVFVGAAFSIAHPSVDWWGEGDEKIYVDGEAFPSHFGTGTEDYYGFAWCCPKPFTHAYHNQTRCGRPQNYGQISVNRFHILDCIPFSRDFRFDMELWMFGQSANDVSVTTYWYARPGSSDGYKPIESQDTWLSILPAYQESSVLGAIEAENMWVRSRKGAADPRVYTPPGQQAASGGYLLEWQDHLKAGDRLDMIFHVPEKGRYRVYLRPVKDDDAGLVQFHINDKKAGPRIDLFRDRNGFELLDEIDLGVFTLNQGANHFIAEIIGAPDSPGRQYEITLDYIRPVRVK